MVTPLDHSEPTDGGRESLHPVAEGEQAFGRYTLRYEIASGGMASVYLGRTRGPMGFDRPVAIKRIHPHLAKKREFVDMFLDEARLNARINHPNVCGVFDFGEVDGTYFMAMEYLVGQPLSRVLGAAAQRGDLAGTPRWNAMATRILADACEGLHAAHELRDEAGRSLNVVHRDFTPQNVFVTYGGAVKVFDFGVARAEGRFHQTETGALKGKLAYMSPEQVRRQPYDRRLDVWAAGVILWELLTLRRLFGRRSEVEILAAIASEPIQPPSLVQPGVPPELDAIVMRALERDPERRTPSARVLARELNQFAASTGISTALADVAELIDELFVDERAQKLGVVAEVLGTSVLDVAAQSGIVSGVHASGAHAEREARARGTGSVSRASGPPPSRRTIVAAGAILFVLAGLGGAVGASWLAGRDDHPSSGPETTTTELGPVVSPPPSVTPVDENREVVETRAETGTGPGGENDTGDENEPEDGSETEDESETGTRIESETATAPGPRTSPTRGRSGTGSVNVATRGGWADIYVDGERVGRTPRSLTLPAGRHVIELRPEGQPAGPRRTVTIRPAQTQRLVVDL
ncbi:MAG: hypothetical protein OHK0013_30930 [Sandaracinaceae bacterium]